MRYDADGWVELTEPPEPQAAGRSGRAPSSPPRQRILDDDRKRLIEVLVRQGRTLREIVTEVGVSHETVRTALWRMKLAA